VNAGSFVSCCAGPVLGEPVTIPSTSTNDAAVTVTDCTGAWVHMSVVLLTSVSVLSPALDLSTVCYIYTHICSASVRFAPAALPAATYCWSLEAPNVFGTGSVL
jgi:hypothetical protein